MKHSFFRVSVFAAALLLPHLVFAADDDNKTKSYSLESINVSVESENKEAFTVTQSLTDPTNGTIYTKKGLETSAKQTNINPIKAIEMSPSVNYTSSDDIGINSQTVKIRGRSDKGPVSTRNIEEIPITGQPGGGHTMFDMENISQIELYKGYMPVDKSLGFGNLIGKENLIIERPTSGFGANLSQSIGSNSFSRSFVRVDTGDIGKLSAFGSVAKTSSDKNKGYGDINAMGGMLGLVYKPTNNFKAEFFASKSKEDFYDYYALSYAETQDLGRYAGKDYGTDKTKSSYYGYNNENFDDTALMANVEYRFSDDSKFVFKPYYFNDEGQKLYASGANVIKWDMNHHLFGSIFKYEKSFFPWLNAKFGYWFHKQLPPGPPVTQQKYTVGANGLVYNGWAQLNRNGYHEINSPFVEMSGNIDKFMYSAGLRYLNLRQGEFNSYTFNTNASTSRDYDTAIANTAVDPWASAKAKYHRMWLPSLYLGYNFAKNLTVYTDYSRTYGTDINLAPTYASTAHNAGSFVSKGVTLQALLDKQKLETSDNIDLGIKYKVGDILINPNLYAVFVKNKQATVYDPTYNVSYAWNVADAFGYGAELSASGALRHDLDFLVGLSYNKFEFTDDIKTSASAIKSTKGNQVPDAPEYMVKAALTYKVFGIGLTPTVKYTSTRYGDVLNQEKVSGVTLVDFDATYEKKNFLGAKSAEFRLSATNVFNKKYISVISASDDASNLSTTYYTGAPFGIYANVNFKF